MILVLTYNAKLGNYYIGALYYEAQFLGEVASTPDNRIPTGSYLAKLTHVQDNQLVIHLPEIDRTIMAGNDPEKTTVVAKRLVQVETEEGNKVMAANMMDVIKDFKRLTGMRADDETLLIVVDNRPLIMNA